MDTNKLQKMFFFNNIYKNIPEKTVYHLKPRSLVLSLPLMDLEQRIKLVSSQIYEGNIKGGINIAASDVDLYKAI